MKKFQKFCLTALSFLAVLALFAPPVAVSAQEVAFDPQQEYVEIVPYNTIGTVLVRTQIYSFAGGSGPTGRWLDPGRVVTVEARLFVNGQWLRIAPGQYINANHVH